MVFQMARRRAARFNKLFNLSDVELAKRALRREQVPQLVAACME